MRLQADSNPRFFQAFILIWNWSNHKTLFQNITKDHR